MRAYTGTLGYRHRALHAPSNFDACIDVARTQVGTFSPLAQMSSLSKRGQVNLRLLIAHLFRSGSPSEIPPFIVSIYVNAVKGMLRRRASTNFCQKIFIGLEAKLNAATAITTVFGVIGVVTDLASATIGSIFGRGLGFSVPSITIAETDNVFSLPTPTGSTVLGNQRCGVHGYSVATVTQTMPESIAVFNARKAHDQQASESLSCKNVDATRMNRIGICRKVVNSHCSKDNSFVNLVRAVERLIHAWRPACILAQEVA